jgi:molecular chaperone GrpE (heat shock protein)
VPQIVSELEGLAPDLARQLEEARIHAEEEQRRWEEERRRREQEAERQRREKARQDAKRDLLTAIDAWDEARRISDFFRAAEVALGQGVGGADPAALDRLRLAKDLIGQPDPLTLLKSWKAPEER